MCTRCLNVSSTIFFHNIVIIKYKRGETKTMSKKLTINKLVSIATLLILFSTVFYSYKQFEDYKNTEQDYCKIAESMELQLNTYIKGILTENVRKTELYLGDNTNIIHKRLLQEYGDDLHGFEEDINNPTPNSILNKILDDVLMDLYINHDSLSNKPFVASMNNIIWNRSIHIPEDNLLWENFVKLHYNAPLAKEAIKAIKDLNVQKNDFIFWEYISNPTPNHTMVTTMKLDELLYVYKTEGFESLKSYEILVPVYITKNGDVFGTNDINSLGQKIDNYKIIVIQRINVYDALLHYKSDLTIFYSEINKIENELVAINARRVSSLIQSVMFIVFVTIGSAFVQNKISSK